MFHITPEGSPLKMGINFYPRKESKTNIGFRIKGSGWSIRVRYSPYTKTLYISRSTFCPT